MVKILFICHVCASFSSVAQTTTTEPAQSLLIFSEDRNIFQLVLCVLEIPILCLLRRSFCAPVLKYKSAQILQLETHARICYNFYKISFVFFIPLGTLVRYTDRKGGEAVEYSDHELVRGIKGGDKSALELLVRRWYPRIYGYVFKLTGHEQDAYDLTQDVFIAMMQSIGSYTPWRKFDSWLFTIAHNKCMDYFRFRQKIVQAEDTMFDRPDPAASLEDMAAVSLSVKAALEKLPAAQREAVILHYFHQFTAKEIARMTNTPLPTIKSRLRAARNTLSNELREDFP